ncbi:Brp/Blh family beta-carotene 15,15'-dioxygenase (plasmid) [Polymorphobacter sp. PAMC 29334]|uniref:Brp/Blh family beta-carotene 15,15'-dioxygenase n=2 Tax=Sphingosinicellaceae TaxID=2820280 RepID=UPI001C6851BE|nr:Brp/Blh family beta-carotene 15,15'-dioxygenase [Polymorphobacter sp. PAMC 29334]QYE33529.1 Brp/Blh family beta-carotene 15,15'-dioxygenase [Polymorphobacter sp. PAMC 29334]
MVHAVSHGPRGIRTTTMEKSTFPGATVALSATVALLVAAVTGVPLSGSTALVAACAAILVFGLPHGALDIELIHRRGRTSHGLASILSVYLGIAAITTAAWLVEPVAALAGFIVIAVIHFAEDWEATDSRFLATGLAVALIAAPAMLHHAQVADIFVALTKAPAAARLADGLLLVGPVALAIAAAGILAMIAARRFTSAAAAIASLIALTALPPVIGFAAFFCLFHSPRHFVGALRAARRGRVAQWLPVVVPVTGAALAIVTCIYLIRGGLAVPERLTAATFMALSILTVPHMLAPILFKRRDTDPFGRRRIPRPAPRPVSSDYNIAPI